MTVLIEEKNANRRLDKFLFAYFNNAPRSFIYKMLRTKKVKLNGAKANGSEILQAGDELRFFLSDDVIESCKKPRIFEKAEPLTGIIYEDDDFLVVNKPAGLPSQGGMTGKSDNLLARMLFYLSQHNDFTDFVPGLCNRLDVNTSGLVICGKNLHALQETNALFLNRGVKKEYLTIVDGNAGEIGAKQTLESFYSKDEKTNTAYITQNETDKTVITAFTVRSVAEKHSLLSVSPITGRSHQIRVHLASIGHPLTGDKKYGGSPFAKTFFLHCERLKIPHRNKIWEAPLPREFKNRINKLFGGIE